MIQRALALREKALRSEHPDVAESLNSLGVVFYSKGEYAKAESFMQQSLLISEKVLGADHRDVATVLVSLGKLFVTKGDYARAEPLFQRALSIQERALGLTAVLQQRGALVFAKLLNQKRWLSITFLLLMVLLPRLARAERLPLKPYTVADGLAHNEINKIVRDSRGFLWFCTADGLSRFDGYTFANFGTDQGLPHANVTDLLETHSGEYWVATNGGLVHFNPKGMPGNRVVYANEETKAAPMFTVVIPNDEDRRAKAITVLLEDRSGTIWCGTLKGLYKLERTNDRFALRPVEIGIPNDYPEQGFVADVLEDRYGSLWVAAPSGLYRRWPDGSAAHYTTREGLPNDYLHDLLEDHQGQLWAGTRSGGFFRLVADNTKAPPVVAQAFRKKDGLPAEWVFQLFETSDRRFWVATTTGLVEFFPNGDEQGRRFHSYTERNGLSYHDVTALNEDLGGNLWMGTNTAGAMKLARDGFITYDVQDGLEQVNAVFKDSAGGICFRGWVLSDRGKSVFEGAKLDLLHSNLSEHVMRFGHFNGQDFVWFLPDALKKPYLGWVGEGLTLQARNGEWWIGTGTGLYRFPAADNFTQLRTARPISVYSTKDALATRQVFRLFEDSRGDVWVATISPAINGLARWDRASNTMRDMANAPGLPSLKDDLPRSLGEDRTGNVWIGFNGGLARHAQGRFRFFTASDGLPPGGIMNIYLDSAGRLWLASARSGLIRVDNSDSSQPVFINYTTAQGLSSNNTGVITEDLHGHIYVGGGNGLDRFDPATGRVKHFTTTDGLAQGSLLAAFRDRNGTLWFGAARGLSRFAPGPDEPSAPPPVLISGLRVAGSPWLVSTLGEREMSLPDLAANQNQLQLDFVALGFASGEVLRYQYKLEGADADWSAPTEQRTVNYARLASGHYKFLVRAVNSDGAISLQPATVSFTILPHLYQRWWFLTLAGLVLGLIGYGWYRSRVMRLLGIERVRTRIAADLHDDIGTNLTRIAILSEVAHSQLNEENPSVANPLSSIARISRESVASMGDIVWAINPKRDSLLDLVLRMRRFANEIFAARKIEFQFHAPETDQDQKLGADLRRDVFLIFKEAVNNAVRHSGCANVEIELKLDPRWLVLKVSDDGSGFEPSVTSEGHGLVSMQRRAKALGSELQLLSRPGKGTEILLKAPRRAR